MPTHKYINLGTKLFLLASLLLPTTGKADTPEPEPRIYGGEICEECGFGAPVVLLKRTSSGCTGTLIHPQVVIFAGHCGHFANTEFTHMEAEGRVEGIDYCKIHPNYNSSADMAWDFGYCVLDNPVTDIPYIPAAYGCEFEMFINADQDVTLCGFGHYTNSDIDYGKRFGHTRIDSVAGAGGYGIITTRAYNGVTACPGDSGGPLLVQTKDGSWRTIGILSTYNGECGKLGVNRLVAIRTGIDWIEESSGIDVTPCFDANGDWHPTEDCGGFWASPDNTAYGTWEKGCPGIPVSGYSSTCGEPYPEFEPDTDTDTDSETDTSSDTDTDTDTDSPPTEDGDDDNGCGCSAVGRTIGIFPLLRSLTTMLTN